MIAMKKNLTSKYDKSKIFKTAWSFVKEKGRTLSEALKTAWRCAKIDVKHSLKKRYLIADWFIEKNLDKFTSNYLVCYQSFDGKSILKETEKAIYVELKMSTIDGGFESKYTRKTWIPKSCVKAESLLDY